MPGLCGGRVVSVCGVEAGGVVSGFNIDHYIDVAERINQFYERYPDGRLCMGSQPSVQQIGDKWYVWYHARAHRFPDDPLPGDGWAAEPVPGPTPYTRDSELMNAETAAWGRAIVALGFGTKKIASRQEVKARTGEEWPVTDHKKAAAEAVKPDASMSDAKRAEVEAFAEKAGFDFWEVADDVFAVPRAHDKMTNAEAKKVCQEILKRKEAKA